MACGKKDMGEEIKRLRHEGYEQDQAVAIAHAKKRKKKSMKKAQEILVSLLQKGIKKEDILKAIEDMNDDLIKAEHILIGEPSPFKDVGEKEYKVETGTETILSWPEMPSAPADVQLSKNLTFQEEKNKERIEAMFDKKVM